MKHTSDAGSTSSLPDLVDADSDESSITEIPSNDDLVIILPPHTSSLVQPFDTPTLSRLFDAESEQTSDADSTSSLPVLASLSGDGYSEEDIDHLPPPIVNLDEVRLDVGLTRQTSRFTRPRPSPRNTAAPRRQRITVFECVSAYNAYVREREYVKP